MDWVITTPPTIEPITLAEAKLHLKVENTTDDSLITSLIKSAREWCEMYQGRTFIEQTITAYYDNFESIFILPQPPLLSVNSVKYIDENGVLQTLAVTIYDIHTECDPGEIRLAYNQTWPTHRDDHNAIRIEYKAGYAVSSGGKTITGVSKANPCVVTAATHGFSTGNSVTLADIVDNGPDGDIETTLNDMTFPITWLSADTFSVPVDTSAMTNTYANGGAATATTLIPESVKAAIKLLIGHLYEHRQAVSEIKLEEVPMTVKNLLGINRNYR